jgi:hypothetical protein
MTGTKDSTIVHRSTYLGRRAEVTTLHLASDPLGIRVVSTRWIDDAAPENGGHPAGTIVKIVCRGDGREDDFEVFATEVTPPAEAS